VILYTDILGKVGIKGIVLYPFILIDSKQKGNLVLLNHEKIHYRQQEELLVLGFYTLYILNFIFNMGRYFFPVLAYRMIIFEKEAKINETDLNYLNKREGYSFKEYV
jgi:hypothetical protein